MKIYEVDHGQPAGSKRREFACLSNKRTDSRLIDSQIGRGVPFVTWKEIELFVFNPSAPRPDFFGLALEHVCNARAHELVGNILSQSGELLPLKVKGEAGMHYLYNCTTVIDVLNADDAIWRYNKEEKTAGIAVPSFHGERIGKKTLFKAQGLWSLSRLFCAEHTGDHRDGEFKALVEHHGLNGLRFDLLWSDTDGPAPPRFRYLKEHPFEYRTADGNPWAFPESKPAAELSARAKRATAKSKKKMPNRA